MSQQPTPPALPLWNCVEGIRIREGWSKVQLARRLGMDRGTISNWQTQPLPPLASTVKTVAERLGIDHEDALRLAGVVTPPMTPSDAVARADEVIAERVPDKLSEVIAEVREHIGDEAADRIIEAIRNKAGERQGDASA
jgi:transcriptional regulator with XRE-family HTH domain